MKSLEIFKNNFLPNFVIKEGTSNNVSIVNHNGTWRLYGDGLQFMQLITKSNREVKELYSSYDLAYGDVLITGLGFGIIALWTCNKPEVTSVTVVENSQDVIDLFLANNKVPNNMTIICADANNYTTNKHYNCLLLDHFSDDVEDAFTYAKIKKVSENLSHDLFWFWSLEEKYADKMYNISHKDLYIEPIDLSNYNFGLKWQAWKKFLQIPTLPNVASDKIQEYVELYTNRR